MAVKTILASLLLLTLISLIQYADATLDLQNKILVSDDENLIIEFGDNTVRSFLTQTTTTPNLEFGIIQLIDQDILLEGAFDDVSVTVLGKSIAIKSLDVPMIIYARNVGDNNYSINLYTIENGGFKKQTFTAILESITAETIPIKEKIETSTIVEPEEKPDLEVIAFQDHTTYWRENYDISLRVFDKKINPIPQFERSFGGVEGVDISVTMTHESGLEVRNFGGKTDSTGYWKGSEFFIENISMPGKYLVTLVASYLGQTVSQDYIAFVIGQVRIVDSTNHAPIANAGSPLTHDSPVTLDGTASTDQDGDSLTFSWSVLTDPGGVIILSFDDSTSDQPLFTTNTPGVYEIQLTVSDGRKTSSDSVTITIT